MAIGRGFRRALSNVHTCLHLSKIISFRVFQYSKYPIWTIKKKETLNLSKHCSTVAEGRSAAGHPHERTIFASKLSARTTEESIRKYFSKYGEVEEVSLIRNTKTGQSKRFAFVQFKDGCSATKLLNYSHFLDERWIRTKKNLFNELRCNKVCVHNLSSELTETILRDHFSQFGKVRSIDFVVDNETHQRKNFCFVEFVSVEATNKALSFPVQDVVQTQVEVRKNIARMKTYVPGKILAGGLDDTVTVEDLRMYFETFGKVLSIEMNFLREGKKSRNFGFVTFENNTIPELVTSSSVTHQLNGRKFRVTKATSDRSIDGRESKVFVENVPAGKSIDEVRNCLEVFGPIDQVHCITRFKPTDDTQCFIIKFATESAADSVARDGRIWLDDYNLITRKLGWTSK